MERLPVLRSRLRPVFVWCALAVLFLPAHAAWSYDRLNSDDTPYVLGRSDIAAEGSYLWESVSAYRWYDGYKSNAPKDWSFRKAQLPLRVSYGLGNSLEVGVCGLFYRWNKEDNLLSVREDGSGLASLDLTAKYGFGPAAVRLAATLPVSDGIPETVALDDTTRVLLGQQADLDFAFLAQSPPDDELEVTGILGYRVRFEDDAGIKPSNEFHLAVAVTIWDLLRLRYQGFWGGPHSKDSETIEHTDRGLHSIGVSLPFAFGMIQYEPRYEYEVWGRSAYTGHRLGLTLRFSSSGHQRTRVLKPVYEILPIDAELYPSDFKGTEVEWLAVVDESDYVARKQDFRTVLSVVKILKTPSSGSSYDHPYIPDYKPPIDPFPGGGGGGGGRGFPRFPPRGIGMCGPFDIPIISTSPVVYEVGAADTADTTDASADEGEYTIRARKRDADAILREIDLSSRPIPRRVGGHSIAYSDFLFETDMCFPRVLKATPSQRKRSENARFYRKLSYVTGIIGAAATACYVVRAFELADDPDKDLSGSEKRIGLVGLGVSLASLGLNWAMTDRILPTEEGGLYLIRGTVGEPGPNGHPTVKVEDWQVISMLDRKAFYWTRAQAYLEQGCEAKACEDLEQIAKKDRSALVKLREIREYPGGGTE